MVFEGFRVGVAAGDMGGYTSAKTKRKDLEEDYDDDFFEFSLASPARKIRRLDVEVPPVAGLEEPLQGIPQQAEASPNEERAIVLYKPVDAALLGSATSSNVFLKVDPAVISGFKNQRFWCDNGANLVETGEEEAEAPTDDGRDGASSRLAVVPWVPSQLSEAAGSVVVSGAEDGSAAGVAMASEEDAEGSSMDVDEEGEGLPTGAAAPGLAWGEGLRQWRQHLCMAPQISPSASTPVMWLWG